MEKALFSSNTVEWATPQKLFDALDRRFSFTLDVCATPENAKCPKYYTKEDDGLVQPWRGERCWMNPPYGRDIKHWVEKARIESEAGTLVVGLLPARTDTAWWHKNVQHYADIFFIPGRLRFGNANAGAPFPSAIAFWYGRQVLMKESK